MSTVKKLYEVTVETKLFVLAENEAEAEEEARHNMHEEESDFIVYEVESANWPIDPSYRGGFPWGGDCEKTVGELLDEMRAPKPPGGTNG